MRNPSPADRRTDARVAGIDGQDVPGLRWILCGGAALVMTVWAMEWQAGLITHWDRWMLPVLACSLLLCAYLHAARPALRARVRLLAVLVFNVYLVITLHLMLLHGGDSPDLYQFLSVMYVLPVAYGVAFLLLPPRWALVMVAGVFAATFVPVAVLALVGGAPTRWPEIMGSLVKVFAAMQVAYVIVLRSVATMRANFQRTHERAELMQTLAATDLLTGQPNRRAMTDELTAALALARRHGGPVSVALIDIDHFKRINDQHGHGVGDRVLVEVARVLAAQLRASDRLGRWGGEEFLMVARETPMHQGLDLAERLRRSIEAWTFAHGEPLTVSVGVSQFLAGDDADTLLSRADKSLYRAKALGRNRSEGLAVATAQ